MAKQISVIIPMYNERPIIENTARTLYDYMSGHFEEGSWEVVFSDDGSSDGSDEAVRALNLPGVRVVGYEKNRGKGCAVRTAMLAAEGDIRMFTDADLAYGTEIIGRFADALKSNPDADILIGSRNLSADGYEGYTFIRRLASKVYLRLLCIVGGFRLTDSQCGCKAFRREAAQKIFSRCRVDGWAFDFEVILRAVKYGFKISEIPVKVMCHRESKIRLLRDALRMLCDLWRMKKEIKREKD